ncbi:MAG TPA: methionine--tRNA ligase subunit beta [Candidatus Limnocylindria bacterium]|nr:methionine--tRNA ligase subunit beta [Candidatus Limnocylindria bacterium]
MSEQPAEGAQPAGAAVPATPAPAAPAAAAPAAEQADTTITIDDFGKIDLRVAIVLAVERVPKTEKLLRLELDLGSEKRTIVSGIAEFYEPETLVGKRIVIVANLKPARIRGVESRGMLLAAGGRGPGEELGLVTLDSDIPPGTRVS